MKLTIFFLFICLFINACSDDDNGGGGDDDRSETQAWIEDTMREHYYWYKDIKSKPDYGLGDEAFFYSLLSNKDGKGGNPYSTIEDLTGNTRSMIRESYSYGIQFTGLNIGTPQAPQYVALILYVVPGSPADKATLDRGDWILSIDGKDITTTKMLSSLFGSVAANFKVARWNPDKGNNGDFDEERNVSIEAARAVIDNPIHTAKTFDRNGTKVGYLIYNHFTAGANEEDESDTSYDDELRRLSSGMFAGVDEFILDLRYNNGGLLSSAQVLCGILTSEASLGQRFGYLRYNDKQKHPNRYFEVTRENQLEPKGKPKGKNLNLKRLFVITSTSTASSSEMIINSLNPFIEVVVIGDVTEGKNVGSVHYPNNDNPYPHGESKWRIRPIVCQISNSMDFTDYANGFEPGTYRNSKRVETGERIDEAFEFFIVGGKEYAKCLEIHPLGDENERLLNVALKMIDGKYSPVRSLRAISGKPTMKIGFNSIDRRATNGVIIDESGALQP